MRTLLKVTIPVEKGNHAVAEGTLQALMQECMQNLKPEAAYFFPENGQRTCYYFFDLKNQADIPQICEPFFTQLNAKCEVTPCMNAEDLKQGLEKLSKKVKTQRIPVNA